MNVLGMRNAAAFGAEPDIKAWSNRVALNPARVPPEHPGSPALDDALERLQTHAGPGVARLAELGGAGCAPRTERHLPPASPCAHRRR